MKITRIDFEGKPGFYATAQRRDDMYKGMNIILVTIFSPASPNGREYHVDADSHGDIWAMARDLQVVLGDAPNTLEDYYAELLKLTDFNS